ncbi:MAG: hypothetical protein AAFY67_17775, partial [Cyanobacteria bacterium J06642_9]
GFSKIADHFRSTSIADEVSASKTLDTIIDILEASDPDFVVPRDTQDDQRIWLRISIIVSRVLLAETSSAIDVLRK